MWAWISFGHSDHRVAQRNARLSCDQGDWLRPVSAAVGHSGLLLCHAWPGFWEYRLCLLAFLLGHTFSISSHHGFPQHGLNWWPCSNAGSYHKTALLEKNWKIETSIKENSLLFNKIFASAQSKALLISLNEDNQSFLIVSRWGLLPFCCCFPSFYPLPSYTFT